MSYHHWGNFYEKPDHDQREAQRLNLAARIYGVTDWEKLPTNARAYLRRIETLIGAPIAMVSTGPDRVHTIVLRHPYQA